MPKRRRELGGVGLPARAGRLRATPEQCAALRRFALGTDLLRRQGLVGDHHLAIALTLDVRDPAERRATLDGVERALAPVARRSRADPRPRRASASPGSTRGSTRRVSTRHALLRACSRPSSWRWCSASTARCARCSPSSLTLGTCLAVSVALHRGDRRHPHDRLADGADEHPRHRDLEPRLPPVALRRAAAGAAGRRAPDLRAAQQVRRRDRVDLRDRGRASARSSSRRSGRSARWASGSRSGSPSAG